MDPVRGIRGAHGGHETAEVRDVRKIDGRRGLRGGAGRRGERVSPGQTQSFRISADQWTTAAQDEGEWLKTAEQGKGVTLFHGEIGYCRESQG